MVATFACTNNRTQVLDMEYFNPTFDQNPQLKKHRQNIYQLTQGDIIAFRTTLMTPDGTPATPDNSRARVAMEDRRFSQEKLWEGEWRNGLKLVDGREGLVEIRIPDSVSSLLRDGAYVLSVSLSSRNENEWSITPLVCYFLVRSQPTSPVSEVPYLVGIPEILICPIPVGQLTRIQDTR